MKKTIVGGGVIFLLTAIIGTGMATETGTMRCAGGIVSVGDTAGEAKSKCGEPAFTSQRQERRVEAGPRGSQARSVAYVTIDDWTFNFGPDQFQYRVLVENGRVSRIESLDYGY